MGGLRRFTEPAEAAAGDDEGGEPLADRAVVDAVVPLVGLLGGRPVLVGDRQVALLHCPGPGGRLVPPGEPAHLKGRVREGPE